MHPAMLAAKRLAAHTRLFVSLLGLLVLITALTCAIPRYLAVAEQRSVSATLASVPPTAAGLQAQIRLADDPAAQSSTVEGVLATKLSGTSAEVFRTVQSDPVEATLDDGEAVSIVLGSYPRFPELARIVDGSLEPGAVAVPVSLAETLGLALGDILIVAEHSLEVTATWEPLDAADPYWFGDPIIGSGESAGAFGPVVMDEATLASLDVNPFARWSILPTASTTAGELPALADAADTLEQALRESPGLTGGVVFLGGLGGTVATIERSIAAVRGVSPVPLVVTVVIGFAALLQLARLLAEVRTPETVLLRARGRSVRSAAGAAAVEAVVVAVPAAVIGALLAILFIPGGELVATLLTAATVALVAVITLTVVATLSAARAHAVRSAAGAALGLVILTIIAAGVSLWQFRLYGSPLVTAADGTQQVDPLAVLAPSLGLVALAMVAVVAFAPLSAAVAGAVAAHRGLGLVLPARQVARRTASFAVALLLVCLSVGGATLASAYSATWGDLNSRAGELRNGTDVSIRLGTSGTVGSASSIVGSTPYSAESSAAAPVLVTTTDVGDSSVALVALSADELPEVMSSLGGLVDTGSVASLIARPAAGVVLPSDATTLAITSTTTVTTVSPGAPLTPGQGDTALTAWVADAQGAMARLRLVDGQAQLPPGVAPFTLIALDVQVTTGPNDANYAFEVAAVNSAELPDEGWQVQPEAFDEQEATGRDSGIGLDLLVTKPGQPLSLRLMPGGTSPVDVVITEAFAERVGLVPGDAASLRFAGSGLSLPVVVVGTVPLVPGSTSPLGALGDLRAIGQELLRATSSVPRPAQVWLASGDPAATAATLVVPDDAIVTTAESDSGGELLRPVVTALWIGAAGSLLLAAAALAAVSGALLRTRRPEITTQRALGIADAEQARGRQRELVTVVVVAVLLGLGAGVAVSVLTVADLARSAVLDAPRTLPADLTFDFVALAALLAVFGVLAAAIVVAHGVAVKAQAAASTGRETSA